MYAGGTPLSDRGGTQDSPVGLWAEVPHLTLQLPGVAYGPRAHIQLRNSRTLRCSNVGTWQVRLCQAWVALQLAIFEVIPTWATEID